jgi:FkbM family methyltransferase
MTMLSYAQTFEDVLLWRALCEVREGFYVDVGAHDPVHDSVTAWFYSQGWSGVNIEPVPEFHARLVAARPRDRNLAMAAGAAPGRMMLSVVGETGLSTADASNARAAAAHQDITARIEVPVQPLRDILAAHGGRDIHFLKIDVEGMERAVLEGMDFRRDRPWVVLIEATRPNSPVENSEAWRDVIEAAGYQDVWFDGLNRWFVPQERAALGALIARPPNPFDRYRLARHETGNEAVSAAIAALRARAEAAEARFARLSTEPGALLGLLPRALLMKLRG